MHMKAARHTGGAQSVTVIIVTATWPAAVKAATRGIKPFISVASAPQDDTRCEYH